MINRQEIFNGLSDVITVMIPRVDILDFDKQFQHIAWIKPNGHSIFIRDCNKYAELMIFCFLKRAYSAGFF